MASAERFPSVAGRSLLGTDLRLPEQFPAARTLVLAAFHQWHQACVDRWFAVAVGAGLPDTTLGLPPDAARAAVELPVLSTRWKPVRRFIDGGMATSIRDQAILARTITVYTDVAGFQGPLGIPGSDHVHALVVSRDGTVHAHESGEPAGAAWTRLAAQLG